MQNAETDWIPVIAIAAAVAGLFDPAFAAIPPALASIFVASLKRQEHAIARVLDDPPRADFKTETRARRRRYVPQRLGSSDLAVATDSAVISTLRATAYLEAMVRADERAQGAAIGGDPTAAQERAEETLVFRERARAAEADRAVWLDAMSIAWAAWAASPAIREGQDAIPQMTRNELEDAITALIGRTGLVVRDLNFHLPDPPAASPRQVAPKRVLVAAQTTRRLARSGEQFFADARTPLAERFLLPEGKRRARRERYDRKTLALTQGDLEQARRSLSQSAERGSPDAMFELGSLAAEANDWEEAHRWFQQAEVVSQEELPSPAIQMAELEAMPQLDFESTDWIWGITPPELDKGEE